MPNPSGAVLSRSGNNGLANAPDQYAGPYTFVFPLANVPQQLNLQQEMSQGTTVPYARSCYVDNTGGTGTVYIDFNNGYKFQVDVGKRAWIPVLASRPIIVNLVTAVNGSTVVLFFTTYDVFPVIF